MNNQDSKLLFVLPSPSEQIPANAVLNLLKEIIIDPVSVEKVFVYAY